jgi:predicted nuclease of predicted toxin-antitoxin system
VAAVESEVKSSAQTGLPGWDSPEAGVLRAGNVSARVWEAVPRRAVRARIAAALRSEVVCMVCFGTVTAR